MLTTSHAHAEMKSCSETTPKAISCPLLPLATAAPDAQPHSAVLLWVPSCPVLPLPRPPPADAADPPTVCSTRESTLGLASNPLSHARDVACTARSCASICCACTSHSIFPSSTDEPLPPSRGKSSSMLPRACIPSMHRTASPTVASALALKRCESPQRRPQRAVAVSSSTGRCCLSLCCCYVGELCAQDCLQVSRPDRPP